MAPFYSSVQVSVDSEPTQNAQYQDPETKAATCNSANLAFIIYICSFPSVEFLWKSEVKKTYCILFSIIFISLTQNTSVSTTAAHFGLVISFGNQYSWIGDCIIYIWYTDARKIPLPKQKCWIGSKMQLFLISYTCAFPAMTC